MASAKRDDQRLITVVMGSTSENQRALESQALLNWGFRFYESHELYAPNKALATPKVWKGGIDAVPVGVARPLLVSTPRGKYQQLKASMDLTATLEGPIAKGQRLGTVKVSLDGKLVAQAPLVALAEVEEAGFFKRLWHDLLLWWQAV
jgi:D-alanyl-D-alanine carboxypeptidase (penicillin-binding protein 5/6)